MLLKIRDWFEVAAVAPLFIESTERGGSRIVFATERSNKSTVVDLPLDTLLQAIDDAGRAEQQVLDLSDELENIRTKYNLSPDDGPAMR